MSTDTPPPARAGTPTETPRTDAASLSLNEVVRKFTNAAMPTQVIVDGMELVNADFARQLERELSALTSANAALAGECRELRGLAKLRDKEHMEVLDLAVKVEEDRNALLRVVEKIAKLKGPGSVIAKTAIESRPPTDGAHAGEK